MDYSIQNLSPDADTVNVLVGSNIDSQITVSVDRDSNWDVCVVITDNSDGSETRMILGSSGYTQKLWGKLLSCWSYIVLLTLYQFSDKTGLPIGYLGLSKVREIAEW